ncbi:MAG: sodium-dependent transporter [Gammaproteobacteria bacterium]|nr:sodium-dependent transporter [Gammaproteobacteria bacterium]NNM13296.1 sodium-dependent transporter [Gammaproteobacteria bacterium]
MAKRESLHGNWSSRMAFILAVTGSAVGLGNIWKFPYITGENGGGAFVLVYLLCVFAVGLPILMSEILMGRRGRRNPVKTMEILGEEEGNSKHWKWLGMWGILAGFLILSFYSVVAGWALAYVLKSMSGAFTGAETAAIANTLGDHLGDWKSLLFWHTLFMIITAIIVGRGVQRGLEKAVQFLMPALFFLLLVLLVYSMQSGSFMDGVKYLFEPDFSKLNANSWIVAMGHAFFTLSVGMGAIMAYGAYLPQNTSIGSTAVMVVFADTLIALLAGLVIFPIVLANGLNPGEGPGLIFSTLPVAFSQMPLTTLFSTLFFVLLSFAALTSAIGLLEPAIAWTVESFKWSRKKAAIIIGIVIWVIGLGTVFSFNLWSGEEYQFFGRTIFDNIDYLSSNIMLPLGGFFISIFAGWIMCRVSTSDELGLGTDWRYTTWLWLSRIIAPLAVLFVMLVKLGFVNP